MLLIPLFILFVSPVSVSNNFLYGFHYCSGGLWHSEPSRAGIHRSKYEPEKVYSMCSTYCLAKSGVAEPCAVESSIAVGYPGTSKQATSGPSDALGRIDEQDHCVVSAPWSRRGAC